jgi:hypothetical protein
MTGEWWKDSKLLVLFLSLCNSYSASSSSLRSFKFSYLSCSSIKMSPPVVPCFPSGLSVSPLTSALREEESFWSLLWNSSSCDLWRLS